MKTKVRELIVEGKRIRQRVDRHGRPHSQAIATWVGGDGERTAKLAMHYAWTETTRAADQRAKARFNEKRTVKSAETRRKAAREHWSNEWLARAHQDNPHFGAKRLAVLARKMVSEERPDIEASKRKEISEHRARQYLKDLRNSGAM